VAEVEKLLPIPNPPARSSALPPATMPIDLRDRLQSVVYRMLPLTSSKVAAAWTDELIKAVTRTTTGGER
jgi:hypothetical protein